MKGIGPSGVLKSAGVTPVHINENIGQQCVFPPLYTLRAER